MEVERYVAVYGRVSEAESTDLSSVPDQLREGREFSGKQWPEAPVIEFSEIQSAATISKRPEFCRLLAKANDGKLRAIVVRDQDRLSRDTTEMLALHRHLSKIGVEIWLYRAGQKLAGDSPTEKLMLTIMSCVSQFEREMAGIRTKARMVSMRNAGQWNGGHKPTGYKVENGVFIPNDKAEAVAEVFKVAAETGSLAEATQASRHVGLWKNKQSVQYALANRVYAGAWHKPDGTWIEDHHAALVSKEIFDAAQETAALPWNPKIRKHDRVFMLQGLLRCSHCNRPLTTHHVKKGAVRFFYYECTARDKTCPVKRLPAADIEEWAWDRLAELCQSPLILKGALDYYEKKCSEVNKDALGQVHRLESRMKQLQSKKTTIMAVLDKYFFNGVVPPMSMTDELLPIEKEQEELKKLIAEAKSKTQPKERLDAEGYLRALRTVMSDGNNSPAKKKLVFKLLIKQIEVEERDINLVLYKYEEKALARAAGDEFHSRPEWLIELFDTRSGRLLVFRHWRQRVVAELRQPSLNNIRRRHYVVRQSPLPTWFSTGVRAIDVPHKCCTKDVVLK